MDPVRPCSVMFRHLTFPDPPIIASSPPNGRVSEGQPLNLTCTQARASISWYKQGSDKPIAHGQELTIQEASSSHEGTYYCASENGSKGSIYVSVISEYPHKCKNIFVCSLTLWPDFNVACDEEYKQ